MNYDFETLMDEAYDLPDGLAKLEVLEAAARYADAEGDIEQGFEARKEIVHTAIFHGYPLKALIAFSWQLGQYDRNPEQFGSFDLMWSYKWIVGQVAHFPEIPLHKIEELVDDLGKRYKEHGYNERTYFYYRFRVAMDLGKMAEAQTYLELFQKAERDYMSDCDACEQNQIVQFYSQLGEHEKALEAAQPILSGAMSCAEVPHITLSYLLLPMLELQSEQDARKTHNRGYRLIKGKRDFIETVGRHMSFLARTDVKKGIELFEHHLAMALDHEDPFHKLVFHLYSAQLLQKLASNGSKYRPRLPMSFLVSNEEMSLAHLADHFAQLALSAAQQYDTRNGNSYYMEWAEEALRA
jgi:tetratricopeptide (TPR) repeat protein